MKKIIVFVFSLCFAFSLNSQALVYPHAKKEKKVIDYHGVKIADDYIWMEDLKNPELQEWMGKQDKLLQSYVRNEPEWSKIKNRIHELGKTGSSYSTPFLAGDTYYFQKSYPGIQHSLIYAKKGLAGEPYKVLDPNEFYTKKSDNLNGYSYSPDGRYAVFFERNGQVGWGNLRIFDLKNKTLKEEVITGVRGNQSIWTYDKEGFYYTCFGSTQDLLERKASPVPVIKYHKIGQSGKEDENIFPAEPKANVFYGLAMSKDGNKLVVEVRVGRSDRNDVILIDTKSQKTQSLVQKNEHLLRYVGNSGDNYFFYTNKNAPNGKIVSLNIRQSASNKWKEIIPEQEQILAGGSTAGGNAMNMIGNQFVLLYRYATHQYLKIYDLKGKKQHEIELETGWIGSGIVGQATEDHAWFTLNTFLDPTSVFGVNLKTGKQSLFLKNERPIDPADYVTRNTYYTSKDGSKVPIYIAHKKGIKMNGEHPIFMYGYGFGGWVAVPWYQAHMMAWLEMGGIYVLPGVRGGGEFGDAWKEAGIKLKRQNAIDDYIAAAEFLISEGYTSAGKIVANGWSASGSLAAASTMQRPDLFGAALIGIPSLDLLRYEEYTQFKGWTGGYGSSSIKEEFQTLYNWSPYHNIKENTCYPPMLVTVGEVDPTTPPQHGYKFVAAMQDHQAQCENPALLKIVWGGGHGFGTDRESSEKTYADELTFLAKVLKIGKKKGQAND